MQKSGAERREPLGKGVLGENRSGVTAIHGSILPLSMPLLPFRGIRLPRQE
jgi:hypothetical protein